MRKILMRDKSNVELHDSFFSVFWHKKVKSSELPYGPVVRTLHFSLPTAQDLSLVRGYPKWSEVAKKKDEN